MPPNQPLATRLRERLERAVREDPAVHGGVLHVDAPGFVWQGAAGLADPAAGAAMRPEDQFQAASITKMLTATSFMTLVEAGAAELDAGIGRYLPAALTEGLHDYGGHAYGAALTPRQLLAHTSGIADFFGDGEPGEGGVLPFVAQMQADPDRLWDPRDLLAWTRANLHPHFAPGWGWHYADTGYVLIGLIIEALTGRPLHEAMRERLLAPLGMDHTYMLFREAARQSLPGRPPSVAHAGASPYGIHRSVSADWGGGGLVVTAADLARFIRAFAEDRIFADAGLRREMLSWTATGEAGVDYGLGVRRFALKELGMPGFGELFGHTGFLKSFMLYWPEQDAVICGTLNQSAAQGAFSRLRPVSALVPAVLRDLRTAGGLMGDGADRAMARGSIALPQPRGGVAASRGSGHGIDGSGYVFVAFFGLPFLIFNICPILFGAVVGFTEWGIIGRPEWVGLANFRDALADAWLWLAFRNTLLYGLIIVPGVVVLALAFAIFVNQGWPLASLARTLFFAPYVVSATVIGLIWVWILDTQFGIVNQYLGVLGIDPIPWLTSTEWSLIGVSIASIWWDLGLAFVLFLAALQDVPQELYEAAEVDGANRWRQFWHVTLPHLRPVLSMVVTLQLISTMRIFSQVYVMTNGGPAGSSASVIHYIYQSAVIRHAMGYASAVSILLFVVILALTALQRALLRERGRG